MCKRHAGGAGTLDFRITVPVLPDVAHPDDQHDIGLNTVDDDVGPAAEDTDWRMILLSLPGQPGIFGNLFKSHGQISDIPVCLVD